MSLLFDDFIQDTSRDNGIRRGVLTIDSSASIALKDELHRLVKPAVMSIPGVENVVM